MGIFEVFDDFQQSVNANPQQVQIARHRRAKFREGLLSAPNVAEVVDSGSLARSTQLAPIHDVDLIAVFEPDNDSEWGQDGPSSSDALDTVHDLVRTTLADPGGSHSELVRLAKPRNRAVKCFVDNPDAEHPFTVDVMPALRNQDGTLLLPSKREQRWTTANPEFLIRRVQEQQDTWREYRSMVRVLKHWRKNCGTSVKSLVMEALALDYLPLQTNRPNALRQFFVAASYNVLGGVRDPAGFCGEIQPNLDLSALQQALSDAGDKSTLAIEASGRGDDIAAQWHWKSVFGEDFPTPPRKSPVPAVAAPPIRDAPQGAR
ncbi:SMODS domain-containing nucleotidyltransferase [Nesterenkonia sp. CF4.4]|uniref:SMODS domain-containing nucleotidyltransferase n=1 Tax=Nesterenkonia sp. CF4.4 TaxID=3373079 RepID=UPI003EE4ECC6